MLVLGTHAVAASVFERLGDDLWLLVPAFLFAMLGSALIGRVLGVRRSFAADRAVGAVRVGRRRRRCRCSSRPNGATDASEGFAPQPVPLHAVRRDGRGGVDRVPGAARGRWRGPRPGCSRCRTRSARCAGGAGGCAGTPRSPASRCATGSGRRSASGRRTTSRRRRPPPVRRLRLALEECGGMFVKLGQILSTRTDLLSADATASSSRLQDNVRPAPRRRDRRAAGGGARPPGRRDVPRVRLAADRGGVDRPGVPRAAARRVARHREGASARASTSRCDVDLSVLEELGKVDRVAHVVGRRVPRATSWSRSSARGCARSSTSGSRRATRTPSPSTHAGRLAHLRARRSTTSSARRACS